MKRRNLDQRMSMAVFFVGFMNIIMIINIIFDINLLKIMNMFFLKKNDMFSLKILFLIIISCFCILSCNANKSKILEAEPQSSNAESLILETELQSPKTEQSQYSIMGSWFLEENDGSPYLFTFTDTECTTLFLGNDKARTARCEIEEDKIFTTIDGMRHEWDYEFQDEDILKINIEVSQRYFIGKRVKNDITTLSGVYRIVNGVGFLYSFEFIDSSNVKITWLSVHGDPIIDDATYEINGKMVILSSEVLERDLEIVGDSILLITGLPNDIIAVFFKY